jgi:hypothetical protein
MHQSSWNFEILQDRSHTKALFSKPRGAKAIGRGCIPLLKKKEMR